MDFSLVCNKAEWCHVQNKLKRPHLHCLTCLNRRYHYSKGDARERFVYLKPNQPFIMVRAITPAMIPKNSQLRYIIINLDGSRLKLLLKNTLFKPFFSIVEVIANW